MSTIAQRFLAGCHTNNTVVDVQFDDGSTVLGTITAFDDNCIVLDDTMLIYLKSVSGIDIQDGQSFHTNH